MKRMIRASHDSTTDEMYTNYVLTPWDDPNDKHYFVTYGEALQYGNRNYNSCCDIEER